MSSLQTKVEAVKSAVCAASTCTPETVVTLKELLLCDTEKPAATKPKTASRADATKARGAPKDSKAKPAAVKGNATPLSSKERTVLATHVINATIKSLTEAAKTPSASGPKDGEPPRQPRRESLKRSVSTPLTPLPSRTLNRVATSPAIKAKPTPTTRAAASAQYVASAECARIAFAALRLIKGPLLPEQTDFQLENGMATLAGKLIALGFHEQALKELRALKKRLDVPAASATAGTDDDVAQLLEFRGTIPPSSRPIATAFQIQVLRLVASVKKPSHIEAILPVVVESHPSSPVQLLSQLAKDNDSEAQKAARQMASLAQILLSLAPSISSKDDHIAKEPRLSPLPATALRLQALAFRTQLRWWKLAKHNGKVEQDILGPLLRCIRSYARRQPSDGGNVYKAISSAFEGISDAATSPRANTPPRSESSLAAIYQILATTAHAARHYNDAQKWLQRLQPLVRQEGAPTVRDCTISARLLAARMKAEILNAELDDLAKEVTEGLDATLSGTAQELNELLESLALARRSAVGLLVSAADKSSDGKVPAALKALLKTFILRYPRFLRRWLGVQPGQDAPAKHILLFDQRRQLLAQSIGQVLDATFMVLKGELQSSSLEWTTLDGILQDSCSLLESLADPGSSQARSEQLGDYFVKASSLYFIRFSLLRKAPSPSKEHNKEALMALSRSIDAVKNRSAAEKLKAQLSTKLELFADLCKSVGRTEEAIKTLRSVCATMAECGVLSQVADALASQPPMFAWAIDTQTSTLSRALRSIAKLDGSWSDWTFFLAEAERAAVLEHLMHISVGEKRSTAPIRLYDPCSIALLRLYTPEKYPLRRLRVLLYLYYQNLGDDHSLGEIASEVEQALQQVQTQSLESDANLVRYLPHMQATLTCLAAIRQADDQFASSASGALATWSSMLETCRSKEDVLTAIDDPDAMLELLTSVNQLAILRGDGQLQVRTMELHSVVTKLIATATSDAVIAGHSLLATQYISVGMFPRALALLSQTKALVEQEKDVALGPLADFYLSHAEYSLEAGLTEEAASMLTKAAGVCAGPHSSWAPSKARASTMLSLLSLLQSIASLQGGDLKGALTHVRHGIKILSHDWSRLEGAFRGTGNATDSDNTTTTETKAAKCQAVGPVLWALAHPFIRSLLQMSAVYAHIGMFQETLYYAEYAWKIAESSQSSLYKAQVASWTSSVFLRAGKLDKAVTTIKDVEAWLPKEASAARIRLAHQLGDFYQKTGDEAKMQHFFQIAEDATHALHSEDGTRAGKEEGEARPVKARTTRGVAVRKTAAKPPTRATQKAPAAQASKLVVAKLERTVPADIFHGSLLAAILLSRALNHVEQRDWESASAALRQLQELPKQARLQSKERLVTAASLIGRSVEQMMSDPVYSVMQESTLSFPCIAGTQGGDKASAMAVVSPQKARSANARKTAKGNAVFLDTLRQAQELLTEAYSSAVSGSESSTVYQLSVLLQDTMMFLSAVGNTKSKQTGHVGFPPSAIDLARNVSWRREQKTILLGREQDIVAEKTDSLTPCSKSSRRSSFSSTVDFSRFQRNYIDHIPESWNVISLSLSENEHDLCITKFRAGHSPFILRLPLERANSRDADSEVFNFQHGRQELLDIIKLANESTHSARDFSVRGERSAWWEEREVLDQRLKDLLAMIETTWLGGFKGAFSQHRRRSDLLARFQTTFIEILDRTLPSRAKTRGKRATKTPPVALDPRILDLFIGLGDPKNPDCEFDEALDDLLYFVVDILQFNGEANAYDEIDFDAMMIETYDALRAYFQAAEARPENSSGSHTVLVLDKALHAFPWESMPCMDGLAVSRVPSLACLQQLIHDAKGLSSNEASGLSGHRVSPSSGTYMLNPSADLKNTQAFFQPSFSALKTWNGIVNRAPEESEFDQALSGPDIFVYFGHGSGAQYIRSKTIRKLDKCKPVSFLMGCSSAALSEVGDFECYGPVWNYMMAGCPAVVGTLWDVTDRDIDRFAGRVFEEWGLFPVGTFKEQKKQAKGKGRAQSVDEDESELEECSAGAQQHGADHPASLAEAIARARDVCRLKYLNAAAVVQYGIPVYLDK